MRGSSAREFTELLLKDVQRVRIFRVALNAYKPDERSERSAGIGNEEVKNNFL